MMVFGEIFSIPGFGKSVGIVVMRIAAYSYVVS